MPLWTHHGPRTTTGMRNIRKRTKNVLDEGHRRHVETRKALAGRRRNAGLFLLTGTAMGLLTGAAAAVGLNRLAERLPESAQRTLAVARARMRGDKVGGLLESTRGTRAPQPVPLFTNVVD